MEARAQSATVPRRYDAGDVHPGVEAISNADPAAFSARLADDVVFHSPAARFSFEGREIASALFEGMVRASDPDQWRVLDFWDLGETHLMTFSTRIGGRQVDLMNVVRLDERGQIRELTVYARPMAAIAVFPAFVFPQLVARYRGRLRTALVLLMCRPLPWILERGVAAGLRIGQPPGAGFDR
jgi:hypothetical protein